MNACIFPTLITDLTFIPDFVYASFKFLKAKFTYAADHFFLT